jgi:glycosyltransferase involved in cell wall biosynthesis
MTQISSLQIIGSKAFGGAERWFQRFSRELAALGHPTELVVRRGYELARADWQGLVHHPLPMRTIWDPLSKWEIRRLIKRLQPQIVQTYMGRATRLTHLQRDRLPVHIARIGGYYKLAGYRHAHAWIGNTKGICDYLVREGFPARRIYQIYNFFEPPSQHGQAARRAVWRIPEEAWLLMTSGRLVPVKGQRYLLEALSRLPVELDGRPLRLLMLGDGPLGDALRRLAETLQIADRVIWAGWQSDPAPFYRMADMVVFPSQDQETFGNVILEAWAFQKPLVCTSFRGAREILHPEEDGLMTPCAEPVPLSEAIRRLILDQSLRDSMIEAGQQRLHRDFAKQPIMQQYIELYRHLIDQYSI